MIEEKLAHKRAQQMEKLQLKQHKVVSFIKVKKVYQSTLILVFQLDVEQIKTEENDRGEASSQKSSADGEITAETTQSSLPYQSEKGVSIYLNLGFSA